MRRQVLATVDTFEPKISNMATHPSDISKPSHIDSKVIAEKLVPTI